MPYVEDNLHQPHTRSLICHCLPLIIVKWILRQISPEGNNVAHDWDKPGTGHGFIMCQWAIHLQPVDPFPCPVSKALSSQRAPVSRINGKHKWKTCLSGGKTSGMRNWESHVTKSDALSGLPHFLLLFTMIFAPNFSITMCLWQVRRRLPWETAPSSALQVFFHLIALFPQHCDLSFSHPMFWVNH